VIFRQIVHDDLGCASYLIGDDDAGVAAVVDPRLDIDEYLRLARYFATARRRPSTTTSRSTMAGCSSWAPCGSAPSTLPATVPTMPHSA
jgi:hypothetical protein